MTNVWIIDDEESIRTICTSTLEDLFQIEAFSSASQALLALNSSKPDLIITDIKMPGMSGLEFLDKVSEKYPDLPTIIITAHANMDNALSAYKGGAFEYLTKPFDINEIRKLAIKATKTKKTNLQDGLEESKSKIVGRAGSMQEVFKAIGKISKTDITVLIRGESGTGKELIAQSVHANSSRNKEPFIAINVAAIPHELLESELFGHEKGSFTGAQSQRIGRFEQALGGTLFLDEIGDMHPELQTRLLRVLSSHEFYRVGGQKPIKSDVRIIAATNQNIEQLIKTGKFREDLYHRLNVFRIGLPPLRKRKEDIPMLVKHFLSKSAAEIKGDEKSIDKNAMKILNDYDWPGNIRQLENTCRYITVMAPSACITADDIPDEIKNDNHSNVSDTVNVNMDGTSLWEASLSSHIKNILSDENDLTRLSKELEKLLLQEALKASKGRRIDAAKILGLGRNTITRKIKDLGLK
ncbi:MAG: nitrogen regulation protein NR(I) [Gammaproteobacteria bacterium]|nr:nitrogen regulation protein NR(I) [Gammaproteobacteria bacterium]MBL6898569.1 nitrogen regulation protein NR(I) [Gammaproteobacteria bacterium]